MRFLPATPISYSMSSDGRAMRTPRWVTTIVATKRLPRPRDPIALAKLIGDIATGQVVDEVEDGKNAAAVELGRRGGLKGGRARANILSPRGDEKLQNPLQPLESDLQISRRRPAHCLAAGPSITVLNWFQSYLGYRLSIL